MDPTIYLTNHSTLVTDAQMGQIAAACATQITRDFVPLHGLVSVPVVFTKTPQPGTRVIDMVDTQDDPQALGWHTEDAGEKVYGVIGAKPCLDSGSKVLSGEISVSSVVSHEVLEMFADPWCSGWCDTGRGYEVAWEVGDPVQSDSYDIGTGVMVSNFVTLEWFNPNASSNDQFDFMKNLRQPCMIDRGGYWVQRRYGREQQKLGRHIEPSEFGVAVEEEIAPGKAFGWGADMPEWLKDVKRGGHGRSHRKLRAATA